MTYPVKIEFKDYPSGGWIDWSQYLVEAPTIDRKVESENEGEAGVIVFDNASVSFRYQSGNPVYSAFSIDLSSKQRYLFRISAPKSNKTYVQLFEGMADFSTITWLEDQEVISFEILDKLSALSLVSNGNNQRQPAIDSIATRIGTAPSGYESNTKGVVYVYDEDNVFGHGSEVVIIYTMPTVLDSGWQRPADTLGDVTYSVPQSLLQTGETLDHPIKTSGKFDGEYNLCLNHGTGTRLLYTGGEATATLHYSWAKVDRRPEGMPLTSATTYGSRLAWANWVYEYFARCYDGWLDAYGYQVPILPECKYRTKQYYNSPDVLLYNGDGSVKAFDGIAVLSEIIDQQWNGITLIRKPVSLSFEIPPTYSTRMVDNLPLGDEPLNTLITLADTTENYIYINRDGNLVIQSKEDLPTNGNTQSLGNTRVVLKEKKYFWDKLADGATVTIKSWIKDQYGEYLEGNATLTMQALAGNGNSQPKNEIKKELLTDSTSDNTQELLDAKALSKATEILNFYGKRHSAYEMELHLDDNVLDWELVDNITLSGVQHFFTAIQFDLIEKTARLTPVEIQGHNYDVRQVVVTYSEDNYNSSSGSSGGGSTQIIIAGDYGPIITALDGLDTTTGFLVQTGDSAFAKRIFTSLDSGKPDHLVITNPDGVIGDINLKINPLAELQFAKVGIGGVVDATYPFRVYGNQKIDGFLNFQTGGVLKINDVTRVSDAAVDLASGGIYKINNVSRLTDTVVNLATGGSYKINNVDRVTDSYVNIASGGTYKINSIDRLADSYVNLASGGAFKINSTDVLNYNTLGSGVINSSLTKVGTVTTGVWNATAINAPYINFNTTNLKNSSNQLNVIQDISITSSPQWVNVTFTGRIDQQGTTDSLFGSQYILPQQKYYGNIGSLQNKWLTLHAAELWVETLVAQETIATIGGRVLVGPTSSLIQDFSSGSTLMYVKHNDFVSGDTVYLEASGKIEFIRINSSYTAVTGGYRYTVIRNLDGTGANDWYSGDAIFNTGQTGSGFIDLYSVRGIKSASQTGPTIVGNIRNSSTYNDWSEAWAIGNLHGLYGYGSDLFGVGLGYYTSEINNIVIDSTNGIRFREYNTVIGSWIGSTMTLGEVAPSKSNVYMSGGSIYLRNNTTSRIALYNDGSGFLASGNINWDYNGNTSIAGWNLDSYALWYGNSTKNIAGNIILGNNLVSNTNTYANGFLIGYGNYNSNPIINMSSSNFHLRMYSDGTRGFFGLYRSSQWRVRAGSMYLFDNTWGDYYGFAVVDTSGTALFRADDGNNNIFAGWKFDTSKLYYGTSSLGIVFNTSATPLLNGSTGKGFEVYDISNPKLFIGDKAGHYMDWNVTTLNKLTIKGNVLASSFVATTAYGTVEVNSSFHQVRVINLSNQYSFMSASAMGIEVAGSPVNELLWLDSTNLRFGGTKVVGTRRTGWTDQTATASRANLGSSPSTSSIASFLRALYDDLKTHGLIGN